MKLRVVSLVGFTVIGLGLDCTVDDVSGIGPLWEKIFFPRFNEITDSLGIWGICLDNGVVGGFHYLACSKVGEGATVPEGMEFHKIPPHRYAVHGYCGLPTEMSKSWQEANKVMLPKAGLTTKSDGPWLEMYPDDCYDAQTGRIT